MLCVGIDLIEIYRIKRSVDRHKFLERILGENEYLQLKKRGFPLESVAANFCAKEAFIKCIGKLYKGFRYRDIELLRDDEGRPYINLNGAAQKIYKESGYKFSVSVTHTKEYASCVIIMTD